MFLKVYVPQRMLRVERKLYSACLNKWNILSVNVRNDFENQNNNRIT